MVVAWDGKCNQVLGMSDEERRQGHNQDYRGSDAWNKKGIAIALIRNLRPTPYYGELFDKSVAVLLPSDETTLPAIRAFVESKNFVEAVRRIDQKVMVTNSTLVKVPFDLAYWQQIAAERYPNGLPEPYSDDPTQWIFHGHPKPSTDPMQVAVARLLGYRWPAEVEAASSRLQDTRQAVASTVEAASSRFQDTRQVGASTVEAASSRFQDTRQDVASTVEAASSRLQDTRQVGASTVDAASSRVLNKRLEAASTMELADLSDDDGIVCLPPVRGEPMAVDRLRALLARAFGEDWSAAREAQLLKDVGCDGMTLNQWLRDKFFEQHVARFHRRPFIWHVWDGHKEGFSALLNYHTLTREKLQTLIHTYLGDWITQLRRAVTDNADASLKLAKAEALKTKLEAILEGDPPYDIFVRWKPLAQQPIGWEPDINDGVRLNIRPFVEAEVLRIPRAKLGIKWEADRGKDVPSAPWYRLGPQYGEPEGTRINNHHTSLSEKRVEAASSRLDKTTASNGLSSMWLEGASTKTRQDAASTERNDWGDDS